MTAMYHAFLAAKINTKQSEVPPLVRQVLRAAERHEKRRDERKGKR